MAYYTSCDGAKCLCGCKSRQVDFTNAFCQASQRDLVFVEMPQHYQPRGCSGKDFVLKLNKSLYGQVTSPKLFWEHIQAGMHQQKFVQSLADPCLFIHPDYPLMVLNYCDDQIWLSPDDNLIDLYVDKLKALGYDLTIEPDGEMFGFLVIEFKRTGTQVQLTHQGLTDKIIMYLGLQHSKVKSTPATTAPSVSNADSHPFSESWNYAAAVGMLLYLASNTRPDIQFAVCQVARFSHAPRDVHAQAVKRIARYLLGTKDKGIIFQPDMKAGLDCYVDADYAGLY